jgi:hypothetical protein
VEIYTATKIEKKEGNRFFKGLFIDIIWTYNLEDSTTERSPATTLNEVDRFV